MKKKGKLPYGRNYHIRQYYAKKKVQEQQEKITKKRHEQDAFVDSIVDAIVDTPQVIPDDMVALFDIEIDQTNIGGSDNIDMDAIRHVFGDIKFEKTDQKQLVKNKVMRIMRKFDNER
jgi:hypothetical protein